MTKYNRKTDNKTEKDEFKIVDHKIAETLRELAIIRYSIFAERADQSRPPKRRTKKLQL